MASMSNLNPRLELLRVGLLRPPAHVESLLGKAGRQRVKYHTDVIVWHRRDILKSPPHISPCPPRPLLRRDISPPCQNLYGRQPCTPWGFWGPNFIQALNQIQDLTNLKSSFIQPSFRGLGWAWQNVFGWSKLPFCAQFPSCCKLFYDDYSILQK